MKVELMGRFGRDRGRGRRRGLSLLPPACAATELGPLFFQVEFLAHPLFETIY